MNQQTVTFVTIGKLAGQTVNLGSEGQFRFVDGEMQVSADIADRVARALRFRCAFPKGDARPFHELACTKLGINPDTLKPLGGELPGTSTVSAVPATPSVAPDAQTTTEVMKAQIKQALESLDHNDDAQWTQKGTPSLIWLKENFLSEQASELATRDFVDSFGIMRQQEID